MAGVRIEAWQCASLKPGAAANPEELSTQNVEWLSVAAPATAAEALRRHGRWNDDQPADLDAHEWWFRTAFEVPDSLVGSTNQPSVLRFHGLAGIADVWLNGQPLLAADNMFLRYDVDVRGRLRESNELIVAFRSLEQALQRKRPRPRWKTSLVANQQLRWQRTSLLGRIPGWSPVAPIVGPWRNVELLLGPLVLLQQRLLATLEDGDGLVALDGVVAIAGDRLDAARLIIKHAGVIAAPVAVGPLEATHDGDVWMLHGSVRVESPQRWHPHTHGTPTRYDCELAVEIDGRTIVVPLDSIGFRKLDIDADGRFSVCVNDAPVYCRGACWTVSDLFRPEGEESQLRRELQRAVDMGANMLRVGGTMTYESDAFYRICDELGLLVWQDFMFANMDYPVDDPTFSMSIHAEARHQLTRLASHPCVVAYCGNSEVEQQAAMLGMPRDRWRNAWFAESLPDLCRELHPGTAYVPSTPSGGALPFHLRVGVSHYYGIGAYQRLPVELRKADVQFTSECLGFANLPEPEVLFEVMEGATPVVHHPRWKSRAPRDSGAGWDFDDVRDFYLKYLYDVDPVALRSFDMQRYLALSRTVSGEMMSQTFAEWRSGHSGNRGGLVWFFKDLCAGASWGLLDHRGLPKPVWYYLRRAWRSRQIALTDEGLEGVHVHVVNETAAGLRGFIELQLLKEPQLCVARQEVPIDVAPRSRIQLSADEEFGLFYDLTHAYRFGPAHHDVVAATLFDENREPIGDAFHFVQRKAPFPRSGTAVRASASAGEKGQFLVEVTSGGFLHTVRITAEGYLPDDNYFHLLPGRTRHICFTPHRPVKGSFKATIEALNWDSSEFVSAAAVAATNVAEGGAR
ncbi:MAG: glycoside hydrolase family 2 protein [Pirellulales bacterium]